MLIIETLPLLRQQIRRLRMEGKRVALVPTMGNLHDGHMKLVDEAKARADVVVVSIFVNPMQFDRPEDLARYPRTLQEDCEKLNKRKVDLVFAPSVKEIYPNGTETHTYVDVPGLSTMLEGASRPGHFRGVSTIVSKLFNLVQPDIACFGEKDFQQLALIRKMVADMGFDIEIVTDGAVYRRQVVSVAKVPTGYRLQLDSAVSATLASIKRISKLHCVRLNSDTVTFTHHAVVGVICSTTLAECPITNEA